MRAFVDRPLANAGAAAELAQVAAQHWGLETPTLLRVGMNAIFTSGNAVLRVSEPSAPASAGIELAEMLTDTGLRVARPVRSDVVRAGPLSATCWERIESTGRAIDWREVGAMVRRVHGLSPDAIPNVYPLPSPTDFPWWNFDALLTDVGDALDEPARDGIVAAIERWPAWGDPAGAVVCHGDVHPGNVMMGADGPVLIDWDLLCQAPAGWDHAPMMTWTERWGGARGVYEALADGYGQSMRDSPSAEAFAELRLVAATLMRVKAGMNNAVAMPEAQNRLAYWRGESGAAPWQAQ